MLALVCACTSRNGTYLVVKGNHDLTFDRVEFYFGKTMMSSGVPGSPAHPDSAPAGAALVASRLYAATDVQQVSAPVRRLNYLLDDVADNRGLGDVVVAIAYRGQTTVGIGELRAFEVASDQVVLYEIALAPFDPTAMEVWGRPAPDCVRWRDPDLGQVVIVRADDVDCDAFPDQGVDCAPLSFCDGTGRGGCQGALGCLMKTATPGCELGGCVNMDGTTPRACTPTLCLTPTACDCIASGTIGQEVQCALVATSTHGPDYAFNIHGNQTLCNEPQDILIIPPNGLPCLDPKVEAAVPTPVGPSHFTFEITTEGPNLCKLTVRPDQIGAMVRYPGLYHMLISLDAGAIPKGTFVLGLQGVAGGCTGQPTIDMGTDPAGTCP